MKKVGLFLLLAIVMVAGCGGGGGDDDDDPTGSTAITDVSGKWAGTGTSEATGTLPTWCNLSQSGTSVTGTWEDKYSVSGSIDGDALHLTVRPYTQDGVTMTGNIEAVVKGDSMSGTVSISGTKGDVVVVVKGTFTVNRTGRSVGRGAAGGMLGTIVRTMVN